MGMSQEHKDALARGRRESRAIKAYLEALANRKPGRPVTTESLQAKIDRLESKLDAETDPLKRVDLLQQRLDATDALRRVSSSADLASLEEEFAGAVKGYSDRKGITYAAWREAGVPAGVLRSAGIARSS